MSDPPVGDGTVIGGRYHLLRQVAGGGMGDVWRARDDRLGRDVAVKLLKSHLADDQVFRLRFRNEALAAAALNHPAIASVFDYGELTSATQGPSAYLVMEFVEGESLEQVLRRQGGLDPASTLELVAQVASGLQAAHDAGIVHRDIKPANLMVRPDGTVKITDFGIARLRDDQQLTQTGTMLGTVEYMSPEQLAGGSATGGSDIYALGVVAYRCLAGRTPFSAPESMAVALAHVNDPVPPMPAEVPGPAADLVLRMLEKDPARRPPSAAAVTEQADSALLLLGDAGFDGLRVAPTGTGGQMAATEVVRGGLTAPMAAATELHDGPAGPVSGTPSASAGRADRRWRSKWAVAIAAALVVALVAVILWAAAGPGPVSLPDLKGTPVAIAKARLGALGLKTGIRTADRAATSAGTVLDQHPVAGSRVPAGSIVALTVASGFVDLTATSLVGEAASTAEATVTAQGLRFTTSSVVSTATPGTVVSVSPSGRIPLGASVTVGVAVAPPVPTTTTTTAPVAPPPGPGGKQPGGSGKGH